MTGQLPKDLLANPGIGSWLAIATDGTVSLRVGKVELGQGILTALVQVAADELDVEPSAVRVQPASTETGPDEGPTAGSMSVADAGAAVAQVCAQVRALFLAAAARHLDVDESALAVRGGHIRVAGGGRSTSYAELAPLVDLHPDVGPPVPTKAAPDLRFSGSSLPRIDLPDKVTGVPRFLSDLVLPGQLWGRVVRPPSAAAVLVDADLDGCRGLPGVVAVVRDGSFLGLVAEDELVAARAAERLRGSSTWTEQPTLPDEDDLASYLRSGPHTTFVVDETVDSGDRVPAERQVRGTYSRPFLAHASMSPSCGAAVWDGNSLRVWSSSQGIFGLQRAIALALGIEPARVVVEHREGAGAYGHNGADDAAFDAVLLGRAVPGRPVHVRWTRADELTWSPFGSAMLVDVVAGVDDTGRITSWESDVFSQGHTSRPGYAGSPGLLAAAHLADPHVLPAPVDPPPERGAGSTRNAIPGYDIATRRIRGHRLDEVALRSSSLRTLGAFTNVFAIESMIDELAALAGADPLAFRLDHLTDERGRAVLLAATETAGWATRSGAGDVGHGIGYARYKERGAYCAVVAEVEAVSEIRLRRLTVAVDVGRVVNPDGVRNQLEGGAVQAASWTLKERVRFDRTRVTSDDWELYPILRFSEAPQVEVILLDRPDLPPVGSGEASQGPAAAAIANAVADALGVRIRDLPITPEQVLATLDT